MAAPAHHAPGGAARPAERYQLIERLGAGGLGVVHRALDRVTGREVALKLMPRPHGGTNLRDEFVALARLRHPNIVAVLDYGLTDAGHEFFTMELVCGPSLADAARPVGSRAFHALLGGVLDALATVHARGMVHADLKPSNVLVDEDALAADPARAARLADFGLAAAAGARGTFLYAAPEAWAGRIDARSDLYSLGVVMYELATRRRPFDGASPHEVLAQQRHGAPVDPRTIDPSIDGALAELITGLCDPAPGARPQSADEVRDRLAEIAGARVGGHVVGDSRSTPRPIGVGGQIVGRERELETLDAAWRDARAGRGRAIVMVGEEGIGKSRLGAEIAVRAQLDGGHAVRVSTAPRAGASWAGVDELVRALLAIAGDAWSGDGRALAPLAAGGEALGDWALAEAVSDLVVTAARRRPIAIVVDDADAAPPPVVALLEYVVRAVADAAALLVIAVRPTEPRDRGGSAPVSAGAARLIAAARAARGGLRLDLPPLDRASTFELAAAAVGVEVGYALGDALHRAAGGNPGHALRALELMAKERRLARQHGAWIAAELTAGLTADAIEVPLPENARTAALSRLAALPPTSRAVLRAAAVIGDRFDRDLLAAALGHPDGAIAAALADDSGAIHAEDDGEADSDGVPHALAEIPAPVAETARPVRHAAGTLPPMGGESRRIDDVPPTREAVEAAVADGVAARVLAADPAAGSFQIAHPQLGALLGDELAPESRALVIARTAATLERRASFGRPVSAACLARLYRAAGDRKGAGRWARRAVDELAGAGDPRAALELGRAVLPITGGRDLADLAERIGDLAAAGGDVALALEHYAIADTQEGGAPGDHVRLALAIAELQRRRGDLAIASALLDEALVVARAHGLGAAQARCHLRLAAVLADRGARDRAGEHAAAGLVLARVAGDRAAAAELGQLAATLALAAGDRRRAVGLLEEALSDATASADPRLAAPVLHALGRAELHGGDPARAAATLERAIAEAAAAGDVAGGARALGDLGHAAHTTGDWSRARRAWERARQLWERLDDRPAIARALVDLAGLYAELGMLDEARALAERAIELATATDQDGVRADARAVLGDVLAASSDLAGARLAYEDALAVHTRLGATAPAIATRRRLAALALAGGRADEAVSRALDAARDARDAGLRFEEAVLHRVAAAATRHTGDAESAAWFLARAREQLGPLGARHELALCDLEAAEQTPGDADALLARAEATLAELGARGDLERVRARRREAAPADRGLDLAALLAGAGDALAAPGLDAEAGAGPLLERLLAASGFDRGFVLSLDDDGRPRVVVRRHRSQPRSWSSGDVEFSGTIVRRVAATGQSAQVGDAALDAALREQKSVIALGLRRIVCAPLGAAGRTVGVVYLDAQSLVPDGPGLELRDLEALAPVFALLVERGWLVSETARVRELMSILAHELRNPLAGILGYAEMVLDPDVDVVRDDAVARIHADAERMGRLVENVLEVTRHEHGNHEWSTTAVDVGALAVDIARGFQVDCERRGLRLALEVEGHPTALGNRDRLAQVVSNLLSNAIKFTPAGGTITIAVRREVVYAGDPTAPPAPATELRAWVPAADGDVLGDVVRLDVRDTGPGMSSELRAQIFAKFTQGAGAARTRGIGIGLYISREIVRRHGGSIWVDSQLGKGATFSVRLPVAL